MSRLPCKWGGWSSFGSSHWCDQSIRSPSSPAQSDPNRVMLKMIMMNPSIAPTVQTSWQVRCSLFQTHATHHKSLPLHCFLNGLLRRWSQERSWLREHEVQHNSSPKLLGFAAVHRLNFSETTQQLSNIFKLALSISRLPGASRLSHLPSQPGIISLRSGCCSCQHLWCSISNCSNLSLLRWHPFTSKHKLVASCCLQSLLHLTGLNSWTRSKKDSKSAKEYKRSQKPKAIPYHSMIKPSSCTFQLIFVCRKTCNAKVCEHLSALQSVAGED